MKKLKVSIIGAAYNEGKNLNNFFNFWLGQKFNNIEILIVNDGSTDNTEEIINSWKKRYPNIIKYIKNKKNKGIGYSRYIGFKNISGDIIKFSDTDLADDYPIDNTFLLRLVNIFNENKNIDTVFVDYIPLIDKNIIRSFENFYYFSINGKTPKNYKNLKKVVSHMPTAFRNKNIDLSGIEDIKNGEDRFLAEKFIKKSRINGKIKGNFIMDGKIFTFNNLFNRYFNYGKNSLGFLKIDKKLFLLHIFKPIIIIFGILCFLLFIYVHINYNVFCDFLLLLPLIFIYLFFLFLTIKYSFKNKNIKNLFLIKLIIFGPLFLILRYIFIFIGIIKLKKL